jgi:hypothetical protein
MVKYGSNGLVEKESKKNKMFFYIGVFFVSTLGLLGVLILMFVLGNLNYFLLNWADRVY